MRVKIDFTFFNKLNASQLWFFMAFLLIVIAAFIIRVPNEKMIDQRTDLALRSIGDGLLKLNGDFSTPVPPVQRIDAETLILKLDQPVAINPDSLVSLSLKYLNSGIAQKSIVSVRAVNSQEIVYGFEIDHLSKKDIPCLGRTLPTSEYVVEVSLYNAQEIMMIASNVPAATAGIGSMLLATLGLVLLRKRKEDSSIEIEWNGIQLDIEHCQINTDQQRIQLTEKETQVLAILLEHVGQLVTREFFLQQIWVKEGVLTDRSLDMYISRLRKKMKVLPNIQIANQRGKGYCLRNC